MIAKTINVIQGGLAALENLPKRERLTFKQTGNLGILVLIGVAIVYVAMFLVQIFIAGTFLGETYRYEDQVVDCFGEACWFYSDRGAEQLDHFFTLAEPLKNAFWLTVIVVGFVAVCALALYVIDKIATRKRGHNFH